MATECPRCHSRFVTDQFAVDAGRQVAVAIGALLLDRAITRADAPGSSASWIRSTLATPTAAALLKHLANQRDEPNTELRKQLRCWRCQHTFRSDD